MYEMQPEYYTGIEKIDQEIRWRDVMEIRVLFPVCFR